MAAIYQWPTFYVEQVFTTTLYPVEVVDSLQVSAELTGGFIQDILKDYLSSVQNISDGEMLQVLLTHSEEDTLTSVQDILEAEMLQILLDESVEDTMYSAQTFTDSDMEAILIRSLMPADEMQITCELTGGSLT